MGGAALLLAAAGVACTGSGRPDADGSAADTAGSGPGVQEAPAVGAQAPVVEPSPGLEGTAWRLAWLRTAPGEGVTAGATLELDPDRGLLTGSTGCRDFQGSYRLVGAQLTLAFSDLGGGACAPAGASLEAAYLGALRDVGSWQLRGDTLELLDEAGVVARFHP